MDKLKKITPPKKEMKNIQNFYSNLANRKNDGKILYFLKGQTFNLDYLIKLSSYGGKPEESLAEKFYKFMKKRELSFDEQIEKFIDKVKREDEEDEGEEENEGKKEKKKEKEEENEGKNEVREVEEVQEEEDEERKKKVENEGKKTGKNEVKVVEEEEEQEEEIKEEDQEDDEEDEEIEDQGEENDKNEDEDDDEEEEDDVKEESEEEQQEEDLSYPYTIQELELKNDCLIMLYKEKYIIKKLIFEEFIKKGTVDFTKMFGKKKTGGRPKLIRAKSVEIPMKKNEPENERQNSVSYVIFKSAATLKSRFSSFLPFN
ncbi:unnamed protein product [Meloidogyne enterolobii]|uniref:Uncharacterized protein n=1 Tax=Meloidogyne enterolobii TaxID=390850 RepID=A0ACB1AX63_MELEN